MNPDSHKLADSIIEFLNMTVSDPVIVSEVFQLLNNKYLQFIATKNNDALRNVVLLKC